MKNDFIKFQLRIPVRCDVPNRNGSVYTREAIEKCLEASNPILVRHNNDVIGYTDGRNSIEYDVNGNLLGTTLNLHILKNIEPEIIVKEMEDDKITSFEIRSISICK